MGRRARVVEDRGQSVPIADLSDVIRSKEAAGRPKDLLHLPMLIQTAQRRPAPRPPGSGPLVDP